MYKYISQRLGNKEVLFNRINVFLGANGTGKSKLLQEIRSQAINVFSISQKQLIYVEGGRTINITGSLRLTRDNFNQYQSAEIAENTRMQKLQHGIANRIQDSLLLLDIKGQALKGQHSDAVKNWLELGSVGNCPLRKEPPLNILIELFHEIFPQITLEFDEKSKQIYCVKNNSPKYNPNTLSEGEKQVFSLLADILLLTESNSVIIVDEPELNLNPKLACKVWDTIENELIDSVFIYATHSVSFTLRENIERVYVLSSENENFSEISKIDEINESELRELLGTIPTILSSSKVLFTEGQDASFDSLFYRWLANGKNGFEILPVGSSNDVKAITSRIGVWNKIAQNIKLKGIIDRDFKSQHETRQYEIESLSVLKFHEAESYLCHPELVEKIAGKLNLVEEIPNADSIVELIFSQLEMQKIKIVAQQVSREASIQASISVSRKSLSDVTDFDALEKHLIEKSVQQEASVKEKIGQERIKELVKEKKKDIEKVIDAKDVETALALLPGKELLKEISAKVGCKSPLSFLRSVSKNISIDEFHHIKSISEKLTEMMN